MSTNFETLIMRDIAASRPAAGVPGRLFYDTTNNKLQRDTGAIWEDCEPTASGTGDVVGPGSATDGNLAVFDGTTGKLLKDGGAPGAGGITMDQADPYGLFHRLDTPDADDDEFDNGSIDAAFVQVNPAGAVTWVESNHVLSAVFNGQLLNDIGVILKPVTLSDGQAFETCLRLITQKETAKFSMTGLVITDGTLVTSNAMAVMFYIDFSNNNCAVDIWKGTVTNLNSGVTNVQLAYTMANDPIRLKLLRNSSTSFSALISTRDGAQFNAFGASVINPGFTPTHAGLFVSAWGNTKIGLATFDYLRKIS